MDKLSMNRIKNVIDQYLDLQVTDIKFDPSTGNITIEAFMKNSKDELEFREIDKPIEISKSSIYFDLDKEFLDAEIDSQELRRLLNDYHDDIENIVYMKEELLKTQNESHLDINHLAHTIIQNALGYMKKYDIDFSIALSMVEVETLRDKINN